MEELIEKLRLLRKRKHMTQAQLAQKIGLPQSHISNIEQGKTDIRVSTFIQLARLLDHEVMLIPRQVITLVESIAEGRKWEANEPRWKPDQEED